MHSTNRTANTTPIGALAESTTQAGVYVRNMMKYAGIADYSEIIEGPGELLNKKGPGEELAEVPASKLLLYPNPAGDVVNVEFEVEEQAQVIFTDMWGREVVRFTVNDGATEQVSTAHLPAGVYVVRLQTTRGDILEIRNLMLQK